MRTLKIEFVIHKESFKWGSIIYVYNHVSSPLLRSFSSMFRVWFAMRDSTELIQCQQGTLSSSIVKPVLSDHYFCEETWIQGQIEL